MTPSRATRAVAWFAWASVAIGLLVRVMHRGPYFPGWDVVGTANGLHLVSTGTLGSLAAYYGTAHAYGTAAWNVVGIPVALLPGLLTSWLAWEFWPHVVTGVIVACSVLVLCRALSVPWSERWTVVLAWGASPALLAFTLSGFPYLSNALPYAVALWIVLRLRSVLGAIAVAAVAVALSWHVQELGRTVFLVFFAGALLLPSVSWRMRATWIVIGCAQYALVAAHHSFNTARYAEMTVPPLTTLPLHAWNFFRYLVLEQGPDLPILLVAGVIGAFAGRNRWFWGALIAVHGGLLFLLSSNSGLLQGLLAVWPRRILLLDFLCVGAAVAAIVERVSLRPALLALLVAGNLWQLAGTLRWASTPLDADRTGLVFAMPYTHTPLHPAGNLDSLVPVLSVDWLAEMRTDLEHGRKLVLAYNLSSYDENATDPAGVIDRLYVGLGHEAFHDRVFSFGRQSVRWATLPVRPMTDLDAFVARMDPADFVGYWLHHPNDDNEWPDAVTNRAERKALFRALRQRFVIEWGPVREDAQHRKLVRFTLRPKSPAA